MRLCINDDLLAWFRANPRSQTLPTDLPGEQANTFGAWPAMRGLGRYYEILVRCKGEADPVTGYFINIKQIDHAVRDFALPALCGELVAAGEGQRPPRLGLLLRTMVDRVSPALGNTVAQLALALTPFYRLTIRSHDMKHVTLHHRYEFAAAHRLHVDELSAEENRRVFGKCNNPAGHGHNYQLEVAVRVPVGEEGEVVPVEALDELVDEQVISVLDHKHLNFDVPQFGELNPSVENIAVVIHGLLEPHVPGLTAEGRASLESVSVWETGKTVCTYRGEGDE